MRFDLNNPGAGASVVFSGQQVLAVRHWRTARWWWPWPAAPSKILTPQGNGLSVAVELQAREKRTVLPSVLEVLQTENGHLEVLVSSGFRHHFRFRLLRRE